AVERMDNVLRHMETVLGDPAVQSNLKETVANLRTASDDARLAVADFRRFAGGLQDTTGDMRRVIGNLNDTVDATHQHIDNLGRRLEQNSDQLARALDYFSSAGRDLAQGQGTLGMLLRDPGFYEALLLTMQR